MGQKHEVGMRVWAWAPELEEAIDGPPRPEGRGWYPAEVAAVDEAAAEMFLNVCTHDVVGDGGEEVLAVSMTVRLDGAEIWVRPRDDSSPPPTYEPMPIPTFLGSISPGPRAED